MKNLIFIGADNVGDAFLTYNILDNLSFYTPHINIFLYNKNSTTTKFVFQQHPNIKNIKSLSTKISFKTFKNIASFYKDIIKLLKIDNVYISSLLGSSTISVFLKPLLLWNKLFNKNKIIIIHLKSLFTTISIDTHLTTFHLQKFSTIIGQKNYQTNTTPLNKRTYQA